ncbi:MAG: ferritin-like domain-containing protein [Marinoscillum sp.]
MKTLQDLFVHQLQDLYSAETQLADALQKMQDHATDNSLKHAFAEHLEETRIQKKRIEQACQIVDVSPEGDRCKAIAGIIAEAEDFIKEASESSVMDAGLIANGQRVEHYEIAAYGTAAHYAKELGYAEVEDILKQTLNEEKSADEKLNELALERINQRAEA